MEFKKILKSAFFGLLLLPNPQVVGSPISKDLINLPNISSSNGSLDFICDQPDICCDREFTPLDEYIPDVVEEHFDFEETQNLKSFQTDVVSKLVGTAKKNILAF